MSFNRESFRTKFLSEVREKSEQLVEGMLLLEVHPENTDILRELMRAAHTIKGSSKMMGYSEAAEQAHALEQCFMDLIEGRVSLSKEYVSSLLQGIDRIKRLFSEEVAPAPSSTPSREEPSKPESLPKEEKREDRSEQSPSGRVVTTTPMVNYLRVGVDDLRELVGNLESVFLDLNTLGGVWETLSGGTRRETREVFNKARSKLDQSIQKLRELELVPLSTVFDPLPRSVRDLALELKKEVQFTVEGRDTVVEKKIIEALPDALVHLIRNALDHGIETQEERKAKGKPPIGSLLLKAYSQKGTIYIQICDDGKGIDWDGVREKALAKGLLPHPEEVTQRDLVKVLTSPGFSTREKVTEISGRGVGMDVVYQSLQRLKGSLGVDSKKDKGTTFTLSFPSTLSLVDSLILETGGNLFALPIVNIDRIYKKEKVKLLSKNQKVYLFFENNALPVLSLAKLFNNERENPHFLVVFNNTFERAVVLVDRVICKEPLLLKETGEFLRGCDHILGEALTKGGQVVPVLDPGKLLEMVKDAVGESVFEEKVQEKRKILLLEDSDLTRAVVEDTLVSAGYLVETAVDGLDGVEKLKGFKPDIILSDVDMPRMDGFQFLKAIRTLGDKTPLLFLSSREGDKEVEKATQLGAEGYLYKSDFSLETLQNALKRMGMDEQENH